MAFPKKLLTKLEGSHNIGILENDFQILIIQAVNLTGGRRDRDAVARSKGEHAE